jgi:valyl-tRNA synthetase
MEESKVKYDNSLASYSTNIETLTSENHRLNKQLQIEQSINQDRSQLLHQVENSLVDNQEENEKLRNLLENISMENSELKIKLQNELFLTKRSEATICEMQVCIYCNDISYKYDFIYDNQ